MTAITVKLVKRLEWETGAKRIDCLVALKESDGNLGRAIKWLKDKGIGQVSL